MPDPNNVDIPDTEMLDASKAEINNAQDLEQQRSTPIPALFNQFYKFIANPSTVSVETFKRMVDTDETVGAGVDFLQTCLAARIGTYIHPSKEITDFVNAALGKLEGGFFLNLKATLEATWAGYSVQEMVWENTELGFMVRKMVPLPPTSLLFEVERTGQLTPDGILQYQRNYNPAGFGYGTGGLFGFSPGGWGQGPDPFAKYGDYPYPIRTGNAYSYMSVRIPVEKCLHLAFASPGQYGNPYGRSILRRAYKWWVTKDGIIRMMATALDRKGTPLLIVYANPNTTVGDQSKMVPGQNQKGNAAFGTTAAEAARKIFENIHNDSTVILPGMEGQVYKVVELGRGSNSEDFLAALNHCDRSIMRALLIPSLIFTNGDGQGSFALGQEHAKTWEKVLDGWGEGVKMCWIHQYVRQLLLYNFPESAWRKDGYGEFVKRELTQEERKAEMDVVATACDKGFIDPYDLKDLNQTREKLGYAPRTTPIERPEENKEEDLDKAPE